MQYTVKTMYAYIFPETVSNSRRNRAITLLRCLVASRTAVCVEKVQQVCRASF